MFSQFNWTLSEFGIACFLGDFLQPPTVYQYNHGKIIFLSGSNSAVKVILIWDSWRSISINSKYIYSKPIGKVFNKKICLTRSKVSINQIERFHVKFLKCMLELFLV